MSTCHAAEGKERKDVQQQEGASNKCDTLEVKASSGPKQCTRQQLTVWRVPIRVRAPPKICLRASSSVSRVLVNVTETCHPVWHGVSVKRVRTWPGVSREITRGPDQTAEGAREFRHWARTLAYIIAQARHVRRGTLRIKCRIFWLLVGELVGKEGEGNANELSSCR